MILFLKYAVSRSDKSKIKMDDKRTAIAIFLCIIFVIAYTETILKPKQPPQQVTTEQAQQAASTQAPSAQPISQQVVPKTPNTTTPQTATPTSEQPITPPALAEVAASPQYIIDTDLFRIKISSLGGRITSLKLKNHKAKLEEKKLLDLVSVKKGTAYPLGINIGGYDDSHVEYSVAGATANIPIIKGKYIVVGPKELSLKLTGTLRNGATLTKTFLISGNSYLFDFKVTSSQPSQDDTNIWLSWNHEINAESKEETLNPKYFSVLTLSNDLEREPALKTTPGLNTFERTNWVSVGDKYFMATILPTAAEARGTYISNDLGEKIINLSIAAEGTQQEGAYKIYLGPKQYNDLRRLGNNLHRTIDLGIFAFLAHPLMWCVNFFYSFLGNYGLAIILLTLAIKLLFLPLTRASMKSMKAMQDLQPEIKALRERVKDPTQVNQEMMALYKRRGVNPMGGCFPMLIQLPVFLGLYNGLLSSIELRHSSFALWITDLSSPERLYIFGIGVPVMILIMGLSMFLQQWTTPSAADPTQKRVMMLMPVIFTVMFIIFPFPSGLVLYWLVNNVISIIQQVFLRSDQKVTPLGATLIASVAIFCLGYVLTLI